MAHGEMGGEMRSDAERAQHIMRLIEDSLAEARKKAVLEGMTDEEFDAAWEQIADEKKTN